MKRLTEILANAADTIIARLWPLDAKTRAYIITDHDQHTAAEGLAEAEADTEVWDAPPWAQKLYDEYLEMEPWERELIGANADPDDLWAAQHRHLIQLPADQTLDEFVTENRQKLWPVTETPTGAANAQPASGAGVVTTDDVANVIAVILRGQGINSAPIYADLAARELAHHFHISRKKEGPCQ